VAVLVDAGLQGRQKSAGLLDCRTGLLGLDGSDQTGLQAPQGDLQRLLLAGQVVVGDRQLGLGIAQGDIGERHLGGNRYLHVSQVGGAGPDRGLTAVQGAAVGAEDIRLPACIETDRKPVDGAVAPRLAALCRGRAVYRRPQGRRRDIAQRPGLTQRGPGAIDTGVGQHRPGHETFEQRIAEAQPPLVKRSGAGLHGAVGCRPSGRDGRHGDAGRCGSLIYNRGAADLGQHQEHQDERHAEYGHCAVHDES
jgi:hypothetical protein